MKNFIQYFTVLAFVFLFSSCNYITYIPRSKTSIRREQPSMMLLESIVDFRSAFNSWPVSRMDMTSKGMKYDKAFESFPYTETEFKVIDSNTMVFYFSGHTKDIDDYNTYRKINLNTYSGKVRFYKENNKFIWKVKMN